MSHNPILLFLCACLLQTACRGCTPEQTLPEPRAEDPGVAIPSLAPRVKFKGPTRWGTLLSQGLDLKPHEVCQELGLYDCLQEVHHITLGGMEPYRLGLHRPLETTPIAAPIAVDRVAISACSERVRRDTATPEDAVIFLELARARQGDLDAIRAMSSRLYERLLGRRARAREVDALLEHWSEDTSDAERWATMSCFALATSVEALFY